MFKNLTNYLYKRNSKEAVGFYIIYLIGFVILSSLISAVFTAIGGTNSFKSGIWLGTLIVVLFSAALSFLILYKKRLLKNFLYISLVLLSVLSAGLGGGLLGLVPAAYLSSR